MTAHISVLFGQDMPVVYVCVYLLAKMNFQPEGKSDFLTKGKIWILIETGEGQINLWLACQILRGCRELLDDPKAKHFA